jgi:DNA polymerase I-like protein with 3'-5' exonuclease and polymerase domains
MIQLYSKQHNNTFKNILSTSWQEFTYWLDNQASFQFDIETSVSDFWIERKLITMQFGDIEGTNQFVIEWNGLTQQQIDYLGNKLEDYTIEKLIHNAIFEYVVCRFHGIEIHNIFCTMLAEKVINGGLENANYSLADISQQYCNVELDKTYQTSFGDGILTYEKTLYAADDVRYLGSIKQQQLVQLKKWDLMNVIELENKACLAFGDVTFYGMKMNKEKWRENIEIAQPIIDASLERLNQWLIADSKLRARAINLGYLKLEDTINFNLNSPAVKRELLQLEFPTITGGTKVIIEKFIRDNKLTTEQLSALLQLNCKDYTELTTLLMNKYKQYLIDNGYVFPGGSVVINWNSQAQVLPLLQAVEPKLADLSAESFGKTSHPIIQDLEEYKDSLKLTTSFGEKFLTLVELDGFIRPNINQIVSTGRPSFSKPNMAQIPAKEGFESIGLIWIDANPGKALSDFYYRYRNAFEYKDGWVFVDSDFIGQELAVIAHIAKDEVWHKAITEGLDLHSICAEMVFKDKWKLAAEPNCAYYKSQQKCKCPKHKTLRNTVKTINFGLAYGMSEFKLASTIRSTVQEAKDIIDIYFKAFPKIKQILTYLGRFGVTKGYIQTLSPYYRKRRFPTWQYSKGNIDNHISGVRFDSNLGSIERQSKNMPIQGASADICKYTMCLIYDYIREHNLKDKVHIVAMVYDQITTVCKAEYAEEWSVVLDKLMCDGALKVVTSGILKADTQISLVWTK